MQTNNININVDNGRIIGRLISNDNILLISRTLIEIGRNSSTSLVDFHISCESKRYVSRKHLILYYETGIGFSLQCISKNGIFVDGIFHTQGSWGIPLADICTIRFPSTNTTLKFESLLDCNYQLSNSNVPNVTESDNTDQNEIEENFEIPTPGTSQNDHSNIQTAEKPPYSYAQLIVQSIVAAPHRQLTLAEIYVHVAKQYPFYRDINHKGWQNSIRHNLSLNKYFLKVPRSQDNPGKGSFWKIDPLFEEKLTKDCYRRRGSNRTVIDQRNKSSSNSSLSESADNTAEFDDTALLYDEHDLIINEHRTQSEFNIPMQNGIKRERELSLNESLDYLKDDESMSKRKQI